MSLSNRYELEIINATTFDENDRAEFPLPPVPLSTSMILASFGVRNPNLNDTTGQYYPSILGVLSAAADITIEANGVMLDQTPSYYLSYLAAIQNLRTTNSAAEDINRFELHNATNLSINRAGAYTIQAARKDYLDTVTNGTQRLNNQIQISPNTTGNAGSVRLADFIGLLDSTPYLPPLVNGKIVVRFNLSGTGYYADNAGAATVAKAFFGLRPRLLVERILVPVEIPRTLTFFRNVCERLSVPAVADGDVQTASAVLTGFNGKYVKDVMVFNRVSTDDSWMLGVQRSPAMYKEGYQVTVNGSTLFPGAGVTQAAEKLQYFNSTFGPLNLPMFAYLPGMSDSSAQIFEAATTEPLQSNMSVLGYTLNTVVQSFTPQVTRTGDNTVGDRINAYDSLHFGRVACQIINPSGDAPVVKF
jgi:hypothetical protein